MKVLCQLTHVDVIENVFGKLNTQTVVLTEERAAHISQRHPEDYALFERFGSQTIAEPDFILCDEKNAHTLLFLRRMEQNNLNTIVRLSIAEEDASTLSNSVMTFYRVRDKNLKKLILRNKLIYRREKT